MRESPSSDIGERVTEHLSAGPASALLEAPYAPHADVRHSFELSELWTFSRRVLDMPIPNLFYADTGFADRYAGSVFGEGLEGMTALLVPWAGRCVLMPTYQGKESLKGMRFESPDGEAYERAVDYLVQLATTNHQDIRIITTKELKEKVKEHLSKQGVLLK